MKIECKICLDKNCPNPVKKPVKNSLGKKVFYSKKPSLYGFHMSATNGTNMTDIEFQKHINFTSQGHDTAESL